MATSNYNGLRVPLIALDYNSRFMAEKKEILFDYKKGKLYVVSAEDKSVIFDITELILKEVEKNVDLSNYTFNIKGVGVVNLGEYIKQLSEFNIKTLDEPNKRYRVPQIKFDNDSISNFDGNIEINGFKSANNNTYPVKDGNVVKWVARTDTDIVDRVRHLEETAPPDAEKFKKLQDDVAKIKITADQYADLPILRRDVDTAKETATRAQTTADGLNGKIESAINNVKAVTTGIDDAKKRLVALEAKEDLTARVKTVEGKVDKIDAKTDYGPQISILQQKVSTLEQTGDNTATINELKQKVSTISDSIETRTRLVNSELEELKKYNATNTQARDALGARIDAYDNLNIGDTLSSYKTRLTALEAIPNLTQNVLKVEQTTNTLTNSFAQLQSKVNGLLSAEDPLPKIRALEAANTNRNNLRQESQVNLAGGVSKEITPGVVYNFLLDTAEPQFTIKAVTDTTQEIILILSPHNIGAQAFNVHITRKDGIELKLPKRIIPSKNNEAQLVRLNSYDGGINWFCTVSPTFVGKDANIDN